jgi:hypothetical protein
MPLVVTIAERVVPWARTLPTWASEQNTSITPVDDGAATSMSTSPTVSRIRRNDPRIRGPLHARHLGEAGDQILGDIESHGQRDAATRFLRPADGRGQVRLAALPPSLHIARPLVV